MSYRDMRMFAEMMKVLAYPRLISMENFRNPNFPLVAEILDWLVRRYDPTADISKQVDTEQDRVIFIKTAAQLMVTRAHIRLNTKKLYQADGYAVKELIKITTLLYGAMRRNTSSGADEEEEDSNSVLSDLANGLDGQRLNELKTARLLASEITRRSAGMFDLVGREVDLREARVMALNRQLTLPQVETGIKANTEQLRTEMSKTMEQLSNIASDEANLEAKIDKKRLELERNQKRLSTLQAVRPAYLDEYERMEEDLSQVYESYLQKFRRLAYLESRLEDYTKADAESALGAEEVLKKAAAADTQRKTDQNPKSMKYSALEDAEDGLSIDSESDEEISRSNLKLKLGSDQNVPGDKRPQKNFGAMMASNADDELTDEDGSDDDEDEDDDDSDGDDDELDNSEMDLEGEEEDGELMDRGEPLGKPGLRPNGAGHKLKPSDNYQQMKRRSAPVEDDEDF